MDAYRIACMHVVYVQLVSCNGVVWNSDKMVQVCTSGFVCLVWFVRDAVLVEYGFGGLCLLYRIVSYRIDCSSNCCR